MYRFETLHLAVLLPAKRLAIYYRRMLPVLVWSSRNHMFRVRVSHTLYWYCATECTPNADCRVCLTLVYPFAQFPSFWIYNSTFGCCRCLWPPESRASHVDRRSAHFCCLNRASNGSRTASSPKFELKIRAISVNVEDRWIDTEHRSMAGIFFQTMTNDIPIRLFTVQQQESSSSAGHQAQHRLYSWCAWQTVCGATKFMSHQP